MIGSDKRSWRNFVTRARRAVQPLDWEKLRMAMCPDGGLLLLGSSVYRKRGFVYRKFKQLHGNDDADDAAGTRRRRR